MTKKHYFAGAILNILQPSIPIGPNYSLYNLCMEGFRYMNQVLLPNTMYATFYIVIIITWKA